jgi:hypothetical protein
MLRHLLLLTFVELIDSKYSIIFVLHFPLSSEVMLEFANMPLFSLWPKCHAITLVMVTNFVRFANCAALCNEHQSRDIFWPTRIVC